MQTSATPNISAELRESIARLRRRLADAGRVLVLTGAGVSAESEITGKAAEVLSLL